MQSSYCAQQTLASRTYAEYLSRVLVHRDDAARKTHLSGKLRAFGQEVRNNGLAWILIRYGFPNFDKARSLLPGLT